MWTKAVEDWEKDPINKINPFDTTVAREYRLCLQ